jgi:phosphonoacetaldehyde hydrolase
MTLSVRNRRSSGPLKAVVLDWAGTAVDFGCMGPVAPFIEVFARRSVSVTIEETRKPMGLMKKDHIRAMFESSEVSAGWFSVFGREPGEDDIHEMYLELEPLMVSTVSRFAEPVPGFLESVEEFRKRGLKIGSTTGYTRSMMDVLAPEAERRGYRPDSVVTSSDVPQGRPCPFMCYKNAINLAVYPMEAMVKVGDTVADIQEGLNAGMWSIGVMRSSNDLGLSEPEAASLPPEELEKRLKAISARFFEAGAHYVAENIGQCPEIIREINERLAAGERP